MAETDILNPTTQFWRELSDSPNPSFGFERHTAANSAASKVRMGAPYSRDTMSQGFAFAMRFDRRPWKTILRLKHFYEQFKGGYFTYIDWDGGGRHHVGRFTTPVMEIRLGNGTNAVQQIIFEEIQRARMLEYPADFVNWSRTINVLDDALNPAVSNFSATPGAWVTQLDPALVGPSASDPSAYELFNAIPTLYSVSPATADFAQIQYVGWGFQMQLRIDASLCKAIIQLDGVNVLMIDLSTGAEVVGGPLPIVPPAGLTCVAGLVTCPNVPLDMHRVKVIPYAAGGSAGISVLFPAVTVIV